MRVFLYGLNNPQEPITCFAWAFFRWGVKELFAEKIDESREISYDDKQLQDILAQGFQLNVLPRTQGV